jgi:hypothetical protein
MDEFANSISKIGCRQLVSGSLILDWVGDRAAPVMSNYLLDEPIMIYSGIRFNRLQES